MTEEDVRVFLRKTEKGLYFFSPNGKRIYFMRLQHVKELIEGKREYVVIRGRPAKEKEKSN